MRRSRNHASSSEAPLQTGPADRSVELRFGDVRLNPVEREAARGGSRLQLTPLEYELLALFILHPREAFSREQLCGDVWGRGIEGRSNHVDVAIMGLRRKLEAGGRPRLIQTVRGYGYALREY